MSGKRRGLCQAAAGGIRWEAVQRDQVYDYHLLFLMLSSRGTELRAKTLSLISSSCKSLPLERRKGSYSELMANIVPMNFPSFI